MYYATIDQFMQERVDTYNPDSSDVNSTFNMEFVDKLQINFKCCGWGSFEDYNENSFLETCNVINLTFSNTIVFDSACDML